jgi:hypothetical protein
MYIIGVLLTGVASDAGTVVTIKDRCSLIRRFQAFTNEFPWRWTAGDYEDFQAERRSGSRPVRLSTLRTDGNTIAMFCGYLVNPAYKLGNAGELSDGSWATFDLDFARPGGRAGANCRRSPAAALGRTDR